MAFDAGGTLYVTNFGDINGGSVIKVNNAGQVSSAIHKTEFRAPELAVTDGFSRLYVGQAGSGAGNFGPNSIHKLDLAGNEITEFTVAEDQRGADWIDLASDKCTIRYTSEGTRVKRFNVCTGTQLSDFASGLHEAYALRITPDGGAIVADTDRIVRLNAAGQVVQIYDAPGEDLWFALDLDVDGTSFWAGTLTTANAYKFNITTGAILNSFHAGDGEIGGVAVYNPARFAFIGPPEPQTLGDGPGGHGTDPTNRASEPVNTATGNYTSKISDAHLPGRGIPLDFVRSYNSLDTSVGVLGRGWSHSFALSLALNPDNSATVTVEGGARLTFASNGTGGFTTPPGATDTLSAGGGGFDLVRRDGLRYHFDASGKLLSETDRNGNAIGLTYTSGQLTTITDPGGRAIALTYDGSGRLETLSVPPGRTVTYTYDPNGRLATATDLGGGTTTYGYDTAGRLASVQDANNNFVVRNTYGPDGRVSGQLDARDNPTAFAWDPATQTSTMTDARGGVWTDVYDSNVLVSSSDPLGNATRFLFDATYHLVAKTDPNGNTTTFEYDPKGNLIRRGAPGQLGFGAEAFTYNSTNDMLTSKDRRGNVTTYTYNAAGNRITATGPAPINAFTQFGYDPAGTGLLFSLTDPRGKVTTFGYDGAGNRTRVTTPLNESATFTFDPAGRIATSVDPRGNVVGGNPSQYTTTFTYNGLDQVLTITDPLTHQEASTYDLVGNRLTTTDPNLHTTTFVYDVANHLESVTDAATKTTSYSYDAVGNLATQTDANTHVTSFVYDLAERLTSATKPLGRVWSFQYDPNGNRTQIIDAKGDATPLTGDGTTTLTYDGLNRLRTVAYSDGTPGVTYTYDGNGNRTQMVDGAGTETYAFDVLDRLTSTARGSDVFNYAYDPAGNVTTRTYPGGAAQTFVYDNDGRLSSGNGATYTYDAASNPLTTLTADGTTARYGYDRAGRLLEVAHTRSNGTLSRFTYGLDPAGNRTSMTTRVGTLTYRYDGLNRLTEACWSQSTCPGGPPAAPLACISCIGALLSRPAATTNPPPGETFRAYTYDPVGNRLTETSNAGPTSYVYDTADRLMSTTAPGNVVTNYTFDANGNQTAAGTRTFTYDLADRTKTATVGTTTETYTYAGDGLRMSASTGSQAAKTTKFLWDRSFALPQIGLERNGSDALLRSYAYGLDLLSQKAGNSVYAYHHDGLGSVTDVTGSTGTSIWWSEVYPYGALRQQGKAGGGNGAPAVQPFNFTGEQLDALTGLYHLRARQYDPGTGRFLATDPAAADIEDPYTSAYVYAIGNPIRYIDPSGRDTQGGCVNFNAGVGPAQVVLELCAVQTSSGQGGVTLTFGGGAGANLDVTFGSGYQYSTGDTLSDLGGPFGGAGGSAAVGVGGYANVFGGAGRCPGKITSGFNAGASIGGGASVSANGTYTIPIQLFGPPDPPCFARPLK